MSDVNRVREAQDPDAAIFDEGPATPCPANFNLAAHTLAAGDADKVALIVAARADDPAPLRLTYSDLREEVARAGAGLRALGVRRGDRVALRIGHSVDFPLLFLGAAWIGAVPAPTSPMLSAEEFDYIRRDLGASVVIASPGPLWVKGAFAPEAVIGAEDEAAHAETRADDLGYVIYTSGSSGRPKGVAHAHRAAWARRMMWRGWYGLRGDDLVLHAGAFNWTYTLGAGLMDPWAAGASTLIYSGPRDPSVWPALIRTFGATIFAAAPGVYRQTMASAGEDWGDTPSLRHGLSAGETMAASLLQAWTSASGKPIYQALGMTEVSTYISSSPDHPHRAGAAGRPQSGRRVAILAEDVERPARRGETGEIAVSTRDDGLMLGYWEGGAPRAQWTGEWFRTGDLGEMDEDGYVAFKGRVDDQMNALGYRVAPEEVEAALLTHPAVREAAATELRVREDLTLIAAFVVVSAPWPEEKDLKAHLGARLAAYKTPKIIRFVDSLPRNANGKLLRRELARRHGWRPEAED